MEPFYEYVDESLDDQSAILMLLKRHKHRCEWFHRERLLKIAAEGGPSEKRLAMDMYEYLHDQGLDFSIEPWSISGEVDLIAAQESDDPLVLDAKVFDGENRSKNYLRKAFNQIYTYTRDYNQPVGYLVIFKTCKHDLKLVLKNSAQRTPFVLYNNKVIFLIVIDLYPYDKPASQRGPLKVVEVTEDDLVSVEGA